MHYWSDQDNNPRNTLTNPAPIDPAGQHGHCCKHCGARWTHSNDLEMMTYVGAISEQEFADEHECPNRCGYVSLKDNDKTREVHVSPVVPQLTMRGAEHYAKEELRKCGLAR